MTVQIGAVILFGFLIVALSTYQATVVPDQNREVEFLHNQEAQTDVVQLSNSISATGTTGDAAPATVDLGTRYPSRTFFVNPPPATGSLRTVEPPGDGNVTLENVDVTSSVDGEANDYWGDPANLNKSTQFVVYAPRYNLYREAPTTRIEQGVAFNNFSAGRNITLTDQQVVEGDRITLLAVLGDLDRSGVSTVSIDPAAVSTVDRRERVSGELNVTFPTTLGAATWAELLADEIDAGWVNATRQAGPNRVTIELNDSRTYSLGIAAVHVGAGATGDPETAYLDVERAPTRMTDGSIREVVVEVRDEYGNPVAGETVEAAAGNGSFSRSTVRTGEDGIAVFEYRADGVGEAELNFTVGGGAPAAAGFDPGAPLNANVTVEVLAGPGGGGGGGSGLSASLPDEVAFVGFNGQNDGDVSSVPADGGTLTDYNSASQVKGIGPKEADLDGDGTLEIPYVDNQQSIRIVDENGEESVFMDDVQAKQLSLSVGDVDGDDAREVLFIGNNNGYLRQIDASDASSSVVTAGGADVTAAYVGGVGDFNGDGDEDIVFVGTNNNEIKYLDDGAVVSTGVVRDADALGQPADLDNDGDLEVPYVTGNGNIEFVDATGNTALAYSGGNAAVAPLASVPDQDGNGADEVVFVRTNNQKLFRVDGESGAVTDLGEKADPNDGAA